MYLKPYYTQWTSLMVEPSGTPFMRAAPKSLQKSAAQERLEHHAAKLR